MGLVSRAWGEGEGVNLRRVCLEVLSSFNMHIRGHPRILLYFKESKGDHSHCSSTKYLMLSLLLASRLPPGCRKLMEGVIRPTMINQSQI